MIAVVVLLVTPMLSGVAEAAENNIAWGARGEQVRQIQQELNDKGYSCGIADGTFGSKTYQAVLRFQRDHGLNADGIVGAKTKAALGGNKQSLSGKTVTVVATAYCPCDKCNYPYGGLPSYIGLPLKYGIVAVDPNVIPMGSKLNIPGYGEGIAADQGNAIKGNRIDLCFPTHQEALKWGIKTVTITVNP